MRDKTRLTLACTVLVSFALLTGCAPKKSFPEKRYYVLDVSRPSGSSPPAEKAVLTVRRFRVSPRYEGKGLVYRRRELSYESDFYNEFLISPGSLLAEEVRQWLAASGLFQNVVDTSSYMEATHILEGNVAALYGDYRERGSPRAVLDVQLFVIDNTSVLSGIVFQQEYRKEVASDGNSAEALVDAWNEALRQVLTDLEVDLRGLDLKTGG